MAEISHSGITNTRKGRLEVTWANVTESDTFEALDLSEVPGAAFMVTIQMSDTIGGATLALHGSSDGTNYDPLSDLTGAEIALTTADKYAEVGEVAVYYKPVASGGSSQSIDVKMVFWMV